VGTGIPITVSDVVRSTVAYFASKSKVTVSGAFRQGDIRHSCASVDKLRATLGFAPQRRFEDGLKEFLGWAGNQTLPERNYEQSLSEMRKIGLMHG